MENKKDLGMPIAIVVSGILIALSIYATGGIKIVNGPTGDYADYGEQAPQEIVINPVSEKDHYVGKLDADIAIVTFTDLECPFCKIFHETMVQVMDEYRDTGKVVWVYRHLPLDSLHTKARREAEAAECASMTGGNVKFWEYVNKIFAYTKSNDSLDMSLIPKIANEIGLDAAKFNNCVNERLSKDAVKAHESDAVLAGAQGTPYSVILTKDGKKISIDGAMPFENVKAAIESVL